MTTTQFLKELNTQGIKLWVEEGNLRFRAPQGALTPALRAEVTARKAELLTLLQEVNRDSHLPMIVPAPADRHRPFPLTDIQQAYWVGRELDGVSTHLYLEIEQQGFDLARVEWAWQQLVARHDMLRAIVLPTGDQQILAETPLYRIAELDLRGMAAATQTTQLATLRQRMSHQKFRAEEWPLFEVRATRLDSERTRLHISIDILMVDMGSYLLLFQEWVRLYQTPATALPSLTLSFRDCVLAEKAIEQSELYKRAQAYWRQRLDTLPPPPELPLLTNAKAGHDHFRRQSLRLAPAHWQQLQQRAAQASLTPSAVLLTAFAEVLNTWSRTSHFTMNLTLLNRLPLHPQINELVGDFTSVFLLEVDNREPASFLTRANRLQKQLWQDLDHRYVSGIWVQRELARRQGGAPQAANPYVFTSGLGMAAFDLTDAGLSNFGETVHHITQTSQVWLDHQVFERSDGSLFYSWDAAEGLFPAGLLDDMFTAYSDLLHNLATDDDLWTAPTRQLVPAAQLAQQRALNATTQALPDGLLHTLFAQKAAAHPHHPAVITPRRTLSYREVDERSNQIAHRLRALALGPDQVVAVVMEKDWEQIVAVYAILKAGAAYTPIDAGFPAERIHLLIDDSQATVVLTQSWVKARGQWPAQVQVLAVDDDTFAAESSTALAPVQQPHHLAYLLYTSGSTGKPKGAMIEHRSIINRMSDIAQRFGLRHTDRALGLTALHHDLSVFDIFGMLSIVGGTVVLPAAALTRDPAHWVDLMTDYGITLWNSVPAFMQMLVAYLEEAPAERSAALALRWTIWAGDFIPVTLPDRLRQRLPKVEIIASGGPTETTVWDIYYRVGAVDPSWSSIPYGKPLANASYYVLNDNLEERPTWVAGELYIGGVGLARGYWRDAERTAAAFITHPVTGERLYRSGDMGRYLPASVDGLPNIEILGRKDFQIKIRGHRIEPGEIETILEQHPLVKRAVVTVIGDRDNRQLIAYAVTGAEVAATDATARLHTNGKNNGYLSHSPHGHSPNGHSPNGHAAQANGFDAHSNGFDARAAERAAFKFKKAGRRLLPAHTPAIDLDAGNEPIDAMRAAYLRRQSYRTYQLTPVTREQLRVFLSYLAPIEVLGAPLPKYLYGSAGSLYPVQAYLYVKAGRVADIPAGLYYYHPDQRRLWLLSAGEVVATDQYFGVNQEPFAAAAFALYLVGKRSAIEPLYGELARDFCLLEAGYMSQLLMMQAPQHQIGLCPIGGIKDPAQLLAQLALDDGDHFLLHSLIGGVIAPEQMIRLARPEGSQPAGANGAAPATVQELLRAYLQTQLPDYMIPKHIVLLDALPLTANGKIDRKSLPDPEIAAQEQPTHAAPASAIEERLTTIVQQVLAMEELSATSNFFDLGANSVHMVLVCNQLQKHFDPDLSVVELFQYPTIRTLAAYLEQRRAAVGHNGADEDAESQSGPEQQQPVGQQRGAARRAARQRARVGS